MTSTRRETLSARYRLQRKPIPLLRAKENEGRMNIRPRAEVTNPHYFTAQPLKIPTFFVRSH